MLLEFGCPFDNNPVIIKQKQLRDDKDKEQFSLSESVYVITYTLKKITNNRQRRYTYELQGKELLNQWFALVDICLLCQDRF